jgi:glycosyltransferase involved in cell wall biosynthesis
MHVNINTVDSGWILNKIADRIIEHNPDPNVRFTVKYYEVDPDADINFYIDLENCYHGQKTKKDVVFFTHAESVPQLIPLLHQRKIHEVDGLISMNQRQTNILFQTGFPQEKVRTIVPGETRDMFPLKKITLGVASRGTYPRYGQLLMQQLLEQYDLTNFRLKMLGDDWEQYLKPIADRNGIDITFQGDADYSVYPEFYHSIDYLLVPVLFTAGPISMQEALSCGVPIITADVGFVNHELTAEYVFPPGNLWKLTSILNSIQKPLLERREQVEHMSWRNYTEQLLKFFGELYDIPNQ